MPPSPSLRSSPGRELRVQSTHKRGRSLESGLPLKAKDDDLVLFKEMQNHERDNFLLHPTDDFEDSISKLKYFSDFKLGITIPPLGESSDLLNADGEKNDYDWLLTPPETPLFPSLDDDEPQPVNMSRGRTRTQPMTISRSSVNEKTPRTSRSSASPHRLSQSPRSSYNTTTQSGPRTSSTPRSSPTPARPATPSRRPSTPPTKPSTPTPRSSTPTMRRMSTGSSGPAISSGRRGTSPVKANRGNSASPKFQGWQSDLPGFSTDAPPNLRTSLSDRSSSRVRGMSPASGNGRDSSLKFGRQSISPSGSRSGSSLHSRERESFTSYSKASTASCPDDDADSVQSISVGISDSSYVQKYGALANSRPIAVSKKPSRTQTASSAPKRSFDSVSRQMDQRKTPHNMFRPLLSSVPPSTFYVGKANNAHRPLFSRNSSLTTSSNASSEHGASVAPDLEDSDHDQSDLASEWEKAKDLGTQEEVFVFDKLDEISEGTGKNTRAESLHSGAGNTNENMTEEIGSQVIESSATSIAAIVSMTPSQSSYAAGISNIDCGTVTVCSICGKNYFTNVDGEEDICQECATAEQLSTRVEAGLAFDLTQDDDALDNKVHLQKELLEQPEKKSSEITCKQHEKISELKTDFHPDTPFQLLMDAMGQQSCEQENDNHDKFDDSETNSGFQSQKSELSASHGLRIDNLEGTGISVLLMQGSSSSKWPVVQGRVFSAANLLISEPSYARENTGALKRSFGPETSSSSSSVDRGSLKPTDAHMLRQLSTKNIEIGNVRNSSNILAPAIGSLSEASSNAGEPYLGSELEIRNLSSYAFGSTENEAIQERLFDAEQKNSFREAHVRASEHASMEPSVTDEHKAVCCDASMVESASDMQLSSQPLNLQFFDTLGDNLHDEDYILCERSTENFCNKVEERSPHIEIPITTLDSSVTEDDHILNGTGFRDDISDTATHTSSMMSLEQHSSHSSIQDLQTVCTLVERPNSIDDPEESCISTSDKDVLPSALDSKIADYAPYEEPNAVIEAPKKDMRRSFTLEEATDTILFCSSIVHDIAYQAATLGMEREQPLAEVPRPTIAAFESSVSSQKYFRKGPNKRTQISRKVKRKKVETDAKVPPPLEAENSVQHIEAAAPSAGVSRTVDTSKPPKLESKCNCTIM